MTAVLNTYDLGEACLRFPDSFHESGDHGLEMNESDVRALALAGESETVEFKRSTGQLSRGGESLCAFLNARGGQVLFGVGPDSQATGQSVSDATMQDVAQVIRRFEPPAPVEIERIPLSAGQEILVLRTSDNVEAMPFTYDGRAYQRIGTTTSVMPQETYQWLLLKRAQHDNVGRTCHHGLRSRISTPRRSSTLDRAPSRRGNWILSSRER
jgi:hypothetical protein